MNIDKMAKIIFAMIIVVLGFIVSCVSVFLYGLIYKFIF